MIWDLRLHRKRRIVVKPVNVVRVTVSLYVSLHPMFTKSDKKWQKDPILTQADLSSQCKPCFLIAQGRQNKKDTKKTKQT